MILKVIRLLQGFSIVSNAMGRAFVQQFGRLQTAQRVAWSIGDS